MIVAIAAGLLASWTGVGFVVGVVVGRSINWRDRGGPR